MTLLITLCLFVSCGGPRRADPAEGAKIYGSRAAAKFKEGRLQSAIVNYRQAYAAAARLDLPLLKARYLFNTGRVWHELGMHDSAAEAYAASRRDFLYYGDTASASFAAGYLAIVAAGRGECDSAFAFYRKGRPARLSGNREKAFWLMVQAHIAIVRGTVPEAQAYLDKAGECYTKEKEYHGVARVNYLRALIARSTGLNEDAFRHLAGALASLDETNVRYDRWRTLLALAEVSFCLRDEEAGFRYHRRAADCAPGGIELPAVEGIRGCDRPILTGCR